MIFVADIHIMIVAVLARKKVRVLMTLIAQVEHFVLAENVLLLNAQ
jgi:hypothetical protein